MNSLSVTAAKTGKKLLMKRLLFLLSFPLFLFGSTISTQITFTGEPFVSLRTITQAFNTIGYKLDIESLSVQNSVGDLRGTLMGNKPFDPAVLAENLKEQSIRIDLAHFDGQMLTLGLDTQKALWNVPLLGRDEGTELKRSSSAQWFRVDEGQRIRIQSPYGSDWYPEIAVMDASMHMLYSLRSPSPEDEFRFELPSGAYYLKLSNTQGMKVLREGMWIESISPGQ